MKTSMMWESMILGYYTVLTISFISFKVYYQCQYIVNDL